MGRKSRFSFFERKHDVSTSSSRHDKLESILQCQSSEPHSLPLKDLKEITSDFSDERLLGQGGFGKVYKGVLRNGYTIAVKKLAWTMSEIQDEQYENEVRYLMMLKHPNIVHLVGYCSETEKELVQYKGKYVYAEKSERLLCLEYMPKGNLRGHLSDESSGLDWHTRYKIIKGICSGLHYLHEEWQVNTPIIHRDMKPENILLDDNMVPKITDFGLSRLFGELQTRTLTKNNYGTLGYMSPEYLNKGIITKELDIFSLGVIIIEIVTGCRHYPDETETSSQEFIELVLKNWKNMLGKVLGNISPEFSCQQIRRCIETALLCVKFDPAKRPTTHQIIEMLMYGGAECSNERLSDTRNTLTGKTVAIESRKQSQTLPERRTFRNNQDLEHPQLSETAVCSRKEFHLQNLNLGNDQTRYCHGRKSTEIVFSPQVPTSHNSRGHSYPTLLVPSRTIRQCPASPTAWQDDSRSCQRSSFPQPLPLPPGSPCLPSHSLQWKKGKLIGCGTFGRVYMGFNSENGQMCTIKEVMINLNDFCSKRGLNQLNREIGLLSQLSHPNIVQYYGSDLSDEILSMYLEYVSGGCIHNLIQDYGPFGEAALRNHTAQILSALAYLHERNIVHRDIKGANILLDLNGDIKLVDFGVAVHISAGTSLSSFEGSPYWMAPEVFVNSNGYSLSVDIWSLGCTVLEMATAKPPWSQYEEVPAMFKIAISKDVPDIPDHLSSEAKSFLKLCLQRDPAARPTAAQLMDHPFVQDHATAKSFGSSIPRDIFPATDGENNTVRFSHGA